VSAVGRVNKSEKAPEPPELFHRAKRVVAVSPEKPDTSMPKVLTNAGFAAAPVLPGASLPEMLGKVKG
jgi:predicted CoA-binding protein